ncbi:MAG: sodium/proline symporter [Armatimonadota bacterium]|nr:sodium/proline symporter [Armatimonadota bacterium]MDR7438171.1 sodium/proline symporter [Armatimonadota bacterium]MDR7472201.1 sodium/proline symporter [Armatimonadota bacterium]MDR7507701.1 sodium/proline symporter [Armatimonadota bacterium]MDR7559679.1 sodium/proline symporter [Armatimonadota bacterium]
MVTSYVVFAVYLVVLLGIGWYFMNRVRTYDDFMIGGRRIGPLASSFSLVSSYMSGYTYTAAPGLSYRSGYSTLWWATGDAPGNALSFGVLGRRLRRYAELLGAITLPEYYERRFNSPTLRVLSGLIVLVTVSMYLVAQFVATGKLVGVMFNTSYVTGMVIGGAVVLLYTLMGGYLAVVYTDVIQFSLMWALTHVLFWTALSLAGGFPAFNDKLAAIDPQLVIPAGPGDAYGTVLAAVTPIVLIIMGSFGLPHVTIRHLSLKDPRNARYAMLITAVFVVLFSFFYYMIGALARVLLLQPPADVEEAGIRLWFMILHPVLAGLMSSAAVASIMSTADSFLILLVSTVAHDFLHRFFMPRATEHQRLRVARILVAVLAVLAFVVAIRPPALVFTIVIFAFGAMALSFGVPNLFSVYWKQTSAGGVVACMVLSLAVYVGATVGKWNIFGLHPFMLGLIVAVLAIFIGSWLTPPPVGEPVAAFDDAAGYGPLPPAVAAGSSATVQREVAAVVAQVRRGDDRQSGPFRSRGRRMVQDAVGI